MNTPAPHHGPEGWAAGVGTAKIHRFFIPDASASVNALAGFFKRGDCRLWGDGRREGTQLHFAPGKPAWTQAFTVVPSGGVTQAAG